MTLEIEDDMDGPVLIYYQVDNFHQNHRGYVKSLSWKQLHQHYVTASGEPTESELEFDCAPLWKNGSRLLHPCGVAPNTLFNDVITLDSPADLVLEPRDDFRHGVESWGMIFDYPSGHSHHQYDGGENHREATHDLALRAT